MDPTLRIKTIALLKERIVGLSPQMRMAAKYVIDHPADVVVYPDERFVTTGDQLSQRRLFFRDADPILCFWIEDVVGICQLEHADVFANKERLAIKHMVPFR